MVVCTCRKLTRFKCDSKLEHICNFLSLSAVHCLDAACPPEAEAWLPLARRLDLERRGSTAGAGDSSTINAEVQRSVISRVDLHTCNLIDLYSYMYTLAIPFLLISGMSIHRPDGVQLTAEQLREHEAIDIKVHHNN